MWRRLQCLPKRYFSSSSWKTPEYIIVGGGSAGCVLANRLSENHKVLLLEAGPKDTGAWDSWKIQMPAALTFNLSDDKYNWSYKTTPQKNLNNRILPWPRGRVLGGSSSLNAMVYIRGHAYDYDRWEKEGAVGWNYASVLPYFQKAQKHELGGNEYRGGEGPLAVSRGTSHDQPLFDAFVAAGVDAGYPYTDDMNGYQQEGFGKMDSTIHAGSRWNTSSAYLSPIQHRDNLRIETNVFVHKVVFEGKRAIGVQIERNNNGNIEVENANTEVILCGGAINSPQLLMLSGVGNKNELQKHDIPIVHELPGVGGNMQDHLDLYIQYHVTKPITLHNATWKYPHKMIKIGAEWFLNKTGKGASAHLESGGFIRR